MFVVTKSRGVTVGSSKFAHYRVVIEIVVHPRQSLRIGKLRNNRVVTFGARNLERDHHQFSNLFSVIRAGLSSFHDVKRNQNPGFTNGVGF